MSEQTTEEPTTEETAAQRRRREREEAKAAADGQPGGEQPGGEQPGEKQAARSKAPDTSTIDLDAINAVTLAVPDLIAAAAPMRERNAQQKAMDLVAARAYEKWVEADRPSVWAKIPVVTYFLEADDVKKYKYLIRRACAIVEPIGDSPGVRVRFGNEFTLSEMMAMKIGHVELAGKTVLAWAAVDKRNVEERESETSTQQESNQS